MSLMEMSVSGGILILAVIVLRALALNRLPKGTFLALWAVAVLRLLVPFSLPSPASVYTLAESVQTQMEAPSAPSPVLPAADFTPGEATAVETAEQEDRHWASPNDRSGGVFAAAWLVGAAVCGTFFLVSYLRCRREFQTALPVEDQRLQAWLAEQRLRRRVTLRQSGRVDAPLTYGLLRPVILLPGNWADTPQFACVLEHELAHIRHLDALWKPALVLTACVHWFNPLVWCMLVLANRDLELRCDEAVVRRLGLDSRSAYALTLISMEEKKSGLSPFASAFSKNAIEERILAIMKMKKRSLAAVIAAVTLVCCIGVGFATSASAKPDTPYPQVTDGSFTRTELDRLASLWFEGYADMTVTEYQQKMWTEFDTPEDMALIERYGQNEALGGYWDDEEATAELDAFHDYFHQVYEPLTASNWKERTFSDAAAARMEDGSIAMLEYDLTMRILDPDVLTVGGYQKKLRDTKTVMEKLTQQGLPEEQSIPVYGMLASTTPDGALETAITYAPLNVSQPADPDAALHAQSSAESANNWDRLLAPYAPFGLTWEFNDPDLDGNGLTMWFEGKEVRSIMDEQEGIWIAEHIGNGFSDGAVELYAVYTDGKLSGLRLATAGEQAGWDAIHDRNSVSNGVPADTISEESREFPQATLADYDALVTLRRRDTENETLESFNQRLLDWANENTDAWNRINCDVIWNDFNKELTTDARTFASITCWFSGTENGQMIRALHTGNPEEDPRWSQNLPMKYNKEDDIVNAWCSLYYDISYHVVDKSKATVQERNACVGGMMNAISAFWQDTDLDALLTMTEADVVSWLNAWAEEASTENIRFNPITEDDIQFEAYDERGIV